jgi:hypothetical protein
MGDEAPSKGSPRLGLFPFWFRTYLPPHTTADEVPASAGRRRAVDVGMKEKGRSQRYEPKPALLDDQLGYVDPRGGSPLLPALRQLNLHIN